MRELAPGLDFLDVSQSGKLMDSLYLSIGLELRNDFFTALSELIRSRLPQLRDPLQKRFEARASETIFGRKVGGTQKGLSIRCQENRHGPATTARGQLYISHV